MIASITLMLGLAAGPVAPVFASPSTGWVESHNARVRLLAGEVAGRAMGGVEIRMAPGWKTYWRMPGEVGGVPPRFDWTGSHNLRSATVLYPAPHRLPDSVGDSIGYKDNVLFPVELVPDDPSRPVELHLAIEYGICREICVPAEAQLELSIPPSDVEGSPELAAAMARVPRGGDKLKPGDPRLKQVKAELAGAAPKLIVETLFPAGTQAADLFIEAPGGLFVALPKKAAEKPGSARFEVDLTQGSTPDELKGKRLVFTLVSENGQSEANWVFP
jgi:DsbC/DsbD-like thiol-disulfide interchange protein